MMESTVPAPQSWRVLGFGKHPDVAAAVQARLRSAGLRARNFALTDDEQGDAQLIRELAEEQYDGIAIGSFINGQDPEDRPEAATTEWFNRVLNIIHLNAPAAKIVLIRNPADALSTIERVLSAP
jgi:hypothetical protein